MSVLGNILWIFLGGGLIIFFEYLLGGILLCFTIVGIPFGVQCIKISMLALMPFGREVVAKPSSSGCLSVIMNIIWIFVCGLGIAVTHLIFAFLCAITIIGIPFAKQHVKLARLAIMPFGSEIR